jgi:general secretion pathway protein K
MKRGVMRPRGMALLAALWLIVAISAVALQFSLAARERRVLGLAAADRGRGIALASGALSVMQARMEYDLRNGPTGQAANAAMSAADPWFGVDSVYTGTVYVDSLPVEIVAQDLGTMININVAQENELRLLFGYVLGNASIADRLAQSIMDWRDVDENPRPNGAEMDQYMDDGRLMLPTNGPFREVDDLIHLYGMTPARRRRVSISTPRRNRYCGRFRACPTSFSRTSCRCVRWDAASRPSIR